METHTETPENAAPQSRKSGNSYQGENPTSPRVFEAGLLRMKCAGENADALRWLYYLWREQGWTMAELARRTKKARTTWSKVFRGVYESPIEGPAKDALAFRREWELSAGADKPDWIETTVAKQIAFVFAKATAARTVAVISGPMGIGKTYALKKLKEEHNHGATLYVRCPACMSFTAFLKFFAAACGVPAHGSADRVMAAVFDNIRARVKTIIIDEMHEPFLTTRNDSCVKYAEFLRNIYDECDVGLVLCGTDVLPDLMRTGKYKAALSQITDRGNLWMPLASKPTADDLRAFYAHYNLGDPPPTAKKLVADILAAHSLRKLCFHFHDGSRLAANSEEPYTWEHFEEAYDLLAEMTAPKK